MEQPHLPASSKPVLGNLEGEREGYDWSSQLPSRVRTRTGGRPDGRRAEGTCANTSLFPPQGALMKLTSPASTS